MLPSQSAGSYVQSAPASVHTSVTSSAYSNTVSLLNKYIMQSVGVFALPHYSMLPFAFCSVNIYGYELSVLFVGVKPKQPGNPKGGIL